MRFAKPWHRWTTVPAGPVVPAVVVGALLLAACGGSHPSSLKSSPTPSSVQPSGGASTSPSESPIPSERPVPAESNPPGDIPDNTQFVPYRSADGKFVVKVPEGWSRVTKTGWRSFGSTSTGAGRRPTSCCPGPSAPTTSTRGGWWPRASGGPSGGGPGRLGGAAGRGPRALPVLPHGRRRDLRPPGGLARGG